jgi:hypothetical protein
MTCSHSTDCELYVQFAADPALNLWKKHYCEGNFSVCSRYKLAQEGKPVPLTLLPNGKVLDQVRSQDDIALTALFNAIQKNRVSMVQTMVRSKISSESVTNKDGVTPLMFAASLGHTDIARILLDAGCDPNKRDRRGNTALDLASKAGHEDCATVIEEYASGSPPSTGASGAAEQPRPERGGLMSRVLGFLRTTTPQN